MTVILKDAGTTGQDNN